MLVAKITKKGQVTIPVEFRRKLGTDKVIVSMEGERVIIEPYKDIGGIFSKYAIKGKSIDEVMKLEKKAVEECIRKKHSYNRR